MKNKFWIFMFNRRQYQIMLSSSLSYHQYTCSQFTLYECYVDGKLLIHKPSVLLYATRFYQYQQHVGPAAEKARSPYRVFIRLTRRSFAVDRSHSPEADECISLQ